MDLFGHLLHLKCIHYWFDKIQLLQILVPSRLMQHCQCCTKQMEEIEVFLYTIHIKKRAWSPPSLPFPPLPSPPFPFPLSCFLHRLLFLSGRKKLKFCSYPAEKSSIFFVPIRPKKAQVLFLPGQKRLKFFLHLPEVPLLLPGGRGVG